MFLMRTLSSKLSWRNALHLKRQAMLREDLENHPSPRRESAEDRRRGAWRILRRRPELPVREVVELPAEAESPLTRAEYPLTCPEYPHPMLEFTGVLTNAKQGQTILTILCIVIIMVICMQFMLAPMMVMFLGIFGSPRPYVLT